jgi:biotin transport system substrate-specific component
MKTTDLILVALFAAMTAIGAQISVPVMPKVPFTLQVFSVLAAGAILGARRGAYSQLVYLLLGAVGLPVFARFGAGFPVLFGPTGGYLWSYPIAAFVVGLAADRAAADGDRRFVPLVAAAMGLGLAVIYGLGIVGLVLFGALPTLARAAQVGVVPFLWLDLVKAGVALLVAQRVRGAMPALAAGQGRAGSFN